MTIMETRMNRVEQRVDKLEERIDDDERERIRAEEKIKSLFRCIEATNKSLETVKRAFYAFAFILLITVVYGAIGRDGFNAVSHALPAPAKPAGVAK